MYGLHIFSIETDLDSFRSIVEETMVDACRLMKENGYENGLGLLLMVQALISILSKNPDPTELERSDTALFANPRMVNLL